MPHIPLIQFLAASVIAGVLGVSGLLLSGTILSPQVAARLEPEQGTVPIGETLVISLVVDSDIPTNVFKGTLTFDTEKLSVQSIDYNTSIANLWAEEPWYSNGDGTLTFTGGTTKAGGFTGTGSLITITFMTKGLGDASIEMTEMQILQHDGLGTEVPLTTPIDALFAVGKEPPVNTSVLATTEETSQIHVVTTAPTRDLNQDGKQSLADISIFMSDLITQNHRSDLNGDQAVTLEDLSILRKE